MNNIANTDIRNCLKSNNIKHWELAKKLGISEYTLVRKLRFELSENEKNTIFKTIEKIKE